MTDPTPGALAAALGHVPGAPEWRIAGDTRVPVAHFGKDHWSTFAYVETRWVDHGGILDHDRMRADAARHPVLATAGRRRSFPTVGDARYATRLRIDGVTVELPDHDDYDCLDDLVAAGFLAVTMPELNGDGVFADARGRVINDLDGAPVGGGFVTGMTEDWLASRAAWSLTEIGQRVAGELRAHRAADGDYGTFTSAL